MRERSPITTHVLDVHRGKPAAGLTVKLERRGAGEEWKPLGRGETNADGRVDGLLAPGAAVEAGVYRLTFDTGAYFAARKVKGFYPFVSICFEIQAPGDHYHVPLLLSGHGYSTYRGS